MSTLREKVFTIHEMIGAAENEPDEEKSEALWSDAMEYQAEEIEAAHVLRLREGGWDDYTTVVDEAPLDQIVTYRELRSLLRTAKYCWSSDLGGEFSSALFFFEHEEDTNKAVGLVKALEGTAFANIVFFGEGDTSGEYLDFVVECIHNYTIECFKADDEAKQEELT